MLVDMYIVFELLNNYDILFVLYLCQLLRKYNIMTA